MLDQYYVYVTAAVVIGLIGSQIFRKSFDPFAPVWMFVLGFAQVYVVQAISYRDWAIRVRGVALVEEANLRALWALLWFLLVYYIGIGRWIAGRLPKAPVVWSAPMVVSVAPPLLIWGLICSGLVIRGSTNMSAEESLLRQFPVLMLVAAVLLIVTGRNGSRARLPITWAGVACSAMYSMIWMFNGKRSHSLFGVLSGTCAFYIARGKRPSLPVLAVTGLLSAVVVTLAIGWRGNMKYEQSASGFIEYIGDFDPSRILVNLNVQDRDEGAHQRPETSSRETEEYGGFLLMMDTVPAKSDYDYGASYLRLVSTFIPRLLWRDKPFFGREQWVDAWIAGSEFKRDRSFTGPAISILGATQLNGGALATAIVLAALATLLRTAYEYFRLYSTSPWAQAWWALTYYNAWLMTVNDDPFVWFYYIYGFAILPTMAFLWIYHRAFARPEAVAWPTAAGQWSVAGGP